MARFKDKAGDEWDIDLTVGMLERLARDADFDLDQLTENPQATAAVLFRSPRKTGQVLWVLCEEQAKARGLDPVDFGSRFDRPTLDRATDALITAVLLFYPRSSAGKAIAGRLPEVLAKMDRDIEEAVGKELDRAFSGTATDSPASSVSIPPS